MKWIGKLFKKACGVLNKPYKTYETIFGAQKMKRYGFPLLIIFSIYLLINFIMLFPVIIAFLHGLPHYISYIMDTTLFKIETKHIAIFSGFIAAILGIAIPISLTVISNLDRRYKQSGISKEFLNEPISRSQFYVLFLNIIFLVAAMFSNSINNFISAVYIVFFC